ncbi:hypothetical protein [Nocardia amikacinitolerans]|uniref:hypothetical protein n=1 Tax=Nocardia amikacinitolerans TaxID=756689 RepID=UPI0020A5D37C|nr:hypothetical protein [Nocardia amikacinitolerans]
MNERELVFTEAERLKHAMISDLEGRMGLLGFREPQPASGVDGIRFAKNEKAIPSASMVVEVRFTRHPRGGLQVNSWAKIESRSVLEIHSALPPAALLKDGELLRDFVDRIDFDILVNPIDPMSLRPVLDLGGTEIRGEWIAKTVAGPVDDWFMKRDSLEKLIELAKLVPIKGGSRKVSPGRLRGVVLLCLVNEMWDIAASLMDWYVMLDSYNVLDSPERIAEFDKALKSRFGQYEALRSS